MTSSSTEQSRDAGAAGEPLGCRPNAVQWLDARSSAAADALCGTGHPHPRRSGLPRCIVDSKPSNTAHVLGQFATKLCRFVDLDGDSAVSEAINSHVARHADLFTECLRPALCHNDFHDGNVLVPGTGKAGG